MIDPNKTAARVISAHKAGDHYLAQSKESLDKLTSLQNDIIPKTGSLDIKLINFIPSCDMIILDRDDYEKGIMKVSINGPYASTTKSKTLDRRHLIFKKRNNPDDFETWLEQFESCWQVGESWSPAKS